MDLSGGLSNHSFTLLLRRFEAQASQRVERAPRPERPANGNRKFGTVGKAVASVLTEAGGEMKLAEIYVAVQARLDGKVSCFSVGDYLRRKSLGEKPLFIRP